MAYIWFDYHTDNCIIIKTLLFGFDIAQNYLIEAIFMSA